MISRSYVISGPYNRQGYTNTSHSREDALAQEDVAPIRVGLLGAGTVGSQTARLLVEQKDELAARIGRPVELTGVACLDPAETDPFPWIDKSVVTTDTMSVATNADIVVELIGGTGVARKFVLAAIESGASVVTANKALLAKYGPEIYAAAEAKGVDIYFEASVGGAIPFLKPLRESLVGDKVTSMLGIVNGTTNYILSRMVNEGLGFDEVLADAQRLGYAEADPTADVDGFDAASKIAILASIGFRTRVNTDDVFMQGIRNVSATDIEMARQFGYAIKLLAIARNTESGVDVRVHPTMIPATHQLASVSGAMNAVFIVGDAVGETMFYGAGAGSFPTASAVVGDVMSLADHIAHGKEIIPESEPFGHNLAIRDIADLETRYYIRLTVADKLGVLAETTKVLADDNISISDINQTKSEDDEACTLIYMTHAAKESDIEKARADLEALDSVKAVSSIIRIENIEAWNEGAFDN